jgi:hypothetical protein
LILRVSGVHDQRFTPILWLSSVPQWLGADHDESLLIRLAKTMTWDEGHRLMFQNLLRTIIVHKNLLGKSYNSSWNLVIVGDLLRSRKCRKNQEALWEIECWI